MVESNGDFKFFVEVDIVKGKEGEEKKMIVQGVASTKIEDRQGEILDPAGYDTSYFLRESVINWHHQSSKDPSSIIGYPTECKVIENGSKFFVKGELFPKSEMAKKVYQLIKDMKGTGRKVGWSIEGKATERDPINNKIVKKARITGIALTHQPIGVGTFADISKAFSGEDLEISIDEEIVKADANGGSTVVFTMDLEGGKKLLVKDCGKVEIKKMLTTTSGAPIMRESLDEDLKKVKEKKLNKALAFEKIFDNFPGITIERAKIIYEKIKEKTNSKEL